MGKIHPIGDGRLLSSSPQDIKKASISLRKGDLVAFPSETVYGLGADATNDLAVAKIYSAKGRPTFNPLIVHVASVEMAQRYVIFDERADALCHQFCPGALSVVLPRKPESPLSLLVSAGLQSVAIRVPSHPVAQRLLRACQLPIAAPSANPSGAVSPTKPAHVVSGWPDHGRVGPDFIIDGGACPIGVESTVIDLTTTTPVLLRPGGLSLEELEKHLGPITRASPNNTAPKSPGMLSRHYAPETPVFLNATRSRPGGLYLGFGSIDEQPAFNLSPAGDLSEAAANLFALLRHMDSLNAKSISVAPIPARGLGMAINDRLARAAATNDGQNYLT